MSNQDSKEQKDSKDSKDSNDLKNIIDVTVYKNDSDYTITTYTAKWCGPCCRVKPFAVDYIENDYNFDFVEEYVMDKKEFKDNINNFIPFFVLDKPSGPVNIQTSDKEVLENFFKQHLNVFVYDEDF